MRNSPTKPFRPGTPIEASTTTVNVAAITGARCWSPPRWATDNVLAPLVDHGDKQEERRRDDPVVHHLEDGAGDRLAGEGEGADDDEADVRERGVGDEALQVLLHRGDDRPVDDADRRRA